MRRNSTQLELITPGATTWLPWISDPGSNRVDGYPNFNGFAGQSRTIREAAWQDFLDSGEELEIIPDPPPPIPEPDWIGFIVEFNLPGNSLYNATATKVQASGDVTKEHWSNLKLGLNISEIRSIEWLQLSYNYLLYLLEVNNQALTIEEKQAWLDMANKHNITIE